MRACGDSSSKRVSLIVIGILSLIPTLLIFSPLFDYYMDLKRQNYYGQTWICDNACSGQYEHCKSISNLPDGKQTYSAIQMFLVSLAVLTDLCLVTISGIHHCGAGTGCCRGAAPPPG